MGHGTGDNRIVAIRNGGFNRTATQENDRCDHTSTNAPDPLRTSQLSVLGETSTRMGNLLGSPRVTPLFWLLRVLFRPTTFRPNGFCPSHCYRCRAIVDPCIRSQDTTRRNHVS